MTEGIWVAIIAFCGTLVGTLGGILAASRVLVYRVDRLEETVKKHNSIIERTYKLEGRMTEAEHEIRDIKGRG